MCKLYINFPLLVITEMNAVILSLVLGLVATESKYIYWPLIKSIACKDNSDPGIEHGITDLPIVIWPNLQGVAGRTSIVAKVLGPMVRSPINACYPCIKT